MKAEAEAEFPLFDTRAVSLEEEAPLECRPTAEPTARPTGQAAQSTHAGHPAGAGRSH